MYNSNLTTAFVEGQKQNARITFTPKTGTALTITNANIPQNGLKIDRYCVSGNKVELGSAISAELTLKLSNRNGEYDDVVFEDGELYVEIGIGNDYIPFGKYTVDTVPRKRAIISLSALDRMVKFDKDIDWSLMTFPTTVGALVTFACTQCGVTLATDLTTLPNREYSVSAEPSIYSFRQLLQNCAYILGTCAYINRVGNLELSWYKESNFSLTAGMRMLDGTDMFEGDIAITGIQYGDNYFAGSDGYRIKNSGNVLLDHSITGVLMNIWSQISGLEYRPYNCTVIAAPFLDPLDIITYVEKDGETEHTSLVTNITYTLNGGTILAAVGETAAIINRTQFNGLTDEQKSDVEALVPFDFKTRYTYVSTSESKTFTFTAYVYTASGVDVTANYPSGSFLWQMRTADGLASLGTGYTKVIPASTIGYGGTVVATFSGDREYTVETTLYQEDVIEEIATNAQDAIDQVTVLSEGKNKVIYADINHQPSGEGLIAGDTWFVLGYVTDPNDQTVISTVAVKRFNGVSWEDMTYSDAAFARINAGNILVGVLKAITIQGPTANNFWNLGTGEWQSYGEITTDDNDRDVSYLQKIAVNILNGLMTIKGEHENVHPSSAEWTDYTEVIPTKNTDYMAIGLNEASLFDPNKVGCAADIEPYGYAGIRLEGDTFKTFGQYQRDVFDSDETQDPTYSEGICFVRPYVTFGPDGIHFNCEYGETYAAANHNYLKYAVTTSGTVTPTTWTLRKEFETWFEQNYEEAANKYVWMMDDTGYGDPLYANDLYDGVMAPKEFLEALYISYEITEGEYGISDTATTQPSEWVTEGDIWLYLSEHTAEANNKYIWVKKNYYWRGSTVYTYNKFLASEYQETYTTPDLNEWLSVPAYNTFDIASGCSTIDSALRFRNNFKTVSTYDVATDKEETHREYSPSDWESSGQGASWPYQPGDSITISNAAHYWGCLYSSGAQLRMTIPLAHPMSEFITGATLTGGKIQVCSVSGTQLFTTAAIPAHTTTLFNAGDPNGALDLAITRTSGNWGSTTVRQTVMVRFSDDATLTFT